jgi:hypothetical protein
VLYFNWSRFCSMCMTMLTPSLCFMMPCTCRMQDQTICFFLYSILPTQMEADRNPEEEVNAIVSMRLAYQDLSVQHKREEERLKVAQIERLSMSLEVRF